MKITDLKFYLCFILQLAFATTYAQGPGHTSYVAETGTTADFALFAAGKAANILVSKHDWPGVRRAAGSVSDDIKAVSGVHPQLITALPKAGLVVIAGTLGKNEWIDQLVKQGKLNVNNVAGKWETYLIQTVNKPFPGVDKALVIAGSDKRGTIFGLYDLSAQMGVSPWYWWADVPAKTKKALYVKAGRYTDGEPAVKYRGIFINDEAPAFSGWTKEKFGGFNSKMYVKVFELILRLKGNYLWPAMWGNAFNTDDPMNRPLADEYGIVMGTSHHEPMDRAQQEWKKFGKGEWDYNKNKEGLQDFWRTGIKNMGNAESVVTIGMRGDGDMAMEQGTNIALLENIVNDQRRIIEEVTKKPAAQTPQVWALYKEVQDYYDKGMRVPDDVTLLLCDDNWGNIRKLPSLTEKPRKGGYGIYYHFDYVGGPRNYKWLNTNMISKAWEQMNLAYNHNARQLWVVNVGDLKPMEYPISFFLDYAWNPERWTAEKLPEYARQWAAQQFGKEHAAVIASMLTKYTRYNARRKPELLNQNTYSLTNYNEFSRVVSDYNDLKSEAEKLYATLQPNYKDAFYQLVLHPIQACANLNEMYFEAAKNAYFVSKGDAVKANLAAERVKTLFGNDKKISTYYNKTLAGGKWNHMMDQTHIGYVIWSDPKTDKMPAVVTLNPDSAKNNAPWPLPAANGEGYIAIEAQNFTKAVGSNGISWKVIPDYGNTLSGVAPWPVTAPKQPAQGVSPRLEYEVDIKDTGTVAVTAYISPTLDFRNAGGLFYAISVDDEQPQLINIATKVDSREWAAAVSDNLRKFITKHHIAKAGKHTIKYWMVDAGVVVQKLVIDLGGLKTSYLGPN